MAMHENVAALRAPPRDRPDPAGRGRRRDEPGDPAVPLGPGQDRHDQPDPAGEPHRASASSGPSSAPVTRRPASPAANADLTATTLAVTRLFAITFPAVMLDHQPLERGHPVVRRAPGRRRRDADRQHDRVPVLRHADPLRGADGRHVRGRWCPARRRPPSASTPSCAPSRSSATPRPPARARRGGRRRRVPERRVRLPQRPGARAAGDLPALHPRADDGDRRQHRLREDHARQPHPPAVRRHRRSRARGRRRRPRAGPPGAVEPARHSFRSGRSSSAARSPTTCGTASSTPRTTSCGTRSTSRRPATSSRS